MNALPAFAEASAGRLFPFDATEVAAELRAAEIRLATSLSAARRSAATIRFRLFLCEKQIQLNSLSKLA